MRKIFFLTVLAAAAAICACSRSAGARVSKAADAVAADSLLPESVKQLVRAVAERDSNAFAALVSYPLRRPYPLRDITDARAMAEYYNVLVDDSLQRVLTSAAPDRWDRYGWRGWSVDDGRYVWLDDSIYSVEYVSAAELGALDRLRALEAGSLVPSLRGDWTPVATLRAVGSPAVYRIDRASGKGDHPVYRLAGFASSERMRGNPDIVMTGFMEAEGSAAVTSYTFAGADGTKAWYSADVADGSKPYVEFTSPVAGVSRVEVEPAYWLDLLPSARQ